MPVQGIWASGAVGAGLLMAAVFAPGVCEAQAWIGQMAGQMVAQEAQAAQEAACRAGAPPPQHDADKALVKIDAIMTAYGKLTPASDPAALRTLFSNAKDARWRDQDGVAPLNEAVRKLPPQPMVLTRTSAVVGGDLASAREIWTAVPASGSPSVVYAVDFIGTPNIFWARIIDWRIWHMAVLPVDKAPTAPGAYCHLDPERAF